MSTSRSSTTLIKKIKHFLSRPRIWVSRIIKIIWLSTITVLIAIPLYIYSVQIDLFGLYGGMPDIREVENPENDLSSEVLSADGVSLGRYFRYNRSQVTYDDLSEDLVNTLLISEDHRYFHHSGLDLKAFVRVIVGFLTFKPAGGGSTITQQLAKNLYTKNPDRDLDGHIAKLGRYPRRIVEKTKEWIIAVDLERNFTKREIIAMYLNTVEFSSNSYGIKVAAETYYGKEPSELNIQESAVLVGMLQNPSRYNPHRWPGRALVKRDAVMRKLWLHQYKIHTKEAYDSMVQLPLDLNFNVQNQNQGLATYFRTVLRNFLIPYCRERNIDLWDSGLKIYTTIDSRLQRYAEDAMTEHMTYLQAQFDEQWALKERNPWSDVDGEEIPDFIEKRIQKEDVYKSLEDYYGKDSDSIQIMLNEKKPMKIFSWNGEIDTVFSSIDSLHYYKKFLHTGMVSMDPNTGHIKAWVGGIDHKYFKFDHVAQGKRQAGSTFKPFVYGLAMEAGYSPCLELKDISPQFIIPGQAPWHPLNADGSRGSGKKMNLRQAMARSVNSITAQMIQALDPQNVVEFAHRVGVESDLQAVPSLCLGTSDVSLLEMVNAYCTFVNGGIHIKPLFITRIEDKNGNVIDNFVSETHHAINEQTAYKMVYMLQGGVEESGGTSRGLSFELKKDNELGGKTGTTDDASDGWYIGVTKDLVSGVWVGGDERAIRFPSWGFGQGGRTARPIWEKYMLSAYADSTVGIVKSKFIKPSSGFDISLDCKNSRQLPDSLISNDKDEWDIRN